MAAPAENPSAAADDESELSQDTRALRITTPLDDDPLLLTKFAGSEGLSEPFRFDMQFLADKNATVDFEKVLGKSATVTVQLSNETKRSWNGIITEFSRNSEDEEYAYYSGVLEPSLILLTLRSDCRIFQEQTVDSILDTLFADLTVEKKFSHEEDRPKRNFCVQYNETDFDFASRLMEEVGIFYHFKHNADEKTHTLVLCDDSSQLSKIEDLADVEFHPEEGGNQDEPAIKEWIRTQRLTSSKVVCRDTHFQFPDKRYEAEKSIGDSFSIGEVTHYPEPTDSERPVYWYPGGYAARYDGLSKGQQSTTPNELVKSPIKNIPSDADREAGFQADLLTMQSLEISASGNVLLLTPGGIFTLAKHEEANADYMVKRIIHLVELGGGTRSAGDDDSLSYSNSFGCQPKEVTYRPARRTPKPKIMGVQPALVVADLKANESDPDKLVEQFYDLYGRVKVWFPWDRRPEPPPEDEEADASASQPAADEAQADDAAAGDDAAGDDTAGDDSEQKVETAKPADRSCWIRVAQPWAGNGYGAFFWPRHGHEVLVAFEHGDPDRPVIVGSLYNTNNMPPVDLPMQQALAGIKSCTLNSNSKTAYNAVTFHDEPKNEHLEFHSEKHTVTTDKASKHSFVSGSRVRVFGSLFNDIGSGVGGGPVNTANLLGQKAVATAKWLQQWRMKGFESDINVTYGHAAKITAGFPGGSTNSVVQGGSMSLVLDPSGWIDNEEIQKYQDILAPMGKWSGVFGDKRSLHYGPTTNIRSGSEIKRRNKTPLEPSDVNWRTGMVGGIITASSLLSVLGWTMQNKDPMIWEQLTRKLGPRGVSGILLNLLIECEKAIGKTDVGTEKQAESSSLMAHAGSLGSDYASLILDLADAATQKGTALATEGQADLATNQAAADSEESEADEEENEEENASDEDADGGDSSDDADSDSDDEEEPQEPEVGSVAFGEDEADVYENYDGLLATSAKHVTIRARASEDDDNDGPSMIHVDAQGADGEDNGAVAITSTAQTTMVCGPTAFQMRRDGDTGQIDATTGDDGTITFSVGPAGAQSVFTMSSDGIKLSVGGDGGPCLELTTSGVTMSCGSNSVAVDASGQTTSAMNVSHEAQAAFSAKGATAALEGSCQATVKGAIAMIN